MDEPIISVEGLSKRYRIQHQQARQPYLALRDVIAQKVTAPFRRLRSQTSPPVPAAEDFWALTDVSFEVRRGEVLGIIGRNGAGKSTLLKVLSRITEPTGGRVVLRGRAASLLEVGTGFHPELTGRDNIFLNGAILGMSRAEIARKFDAIVDFAGTERFLDTPVKRYSSGMYVRLAFAVAAHLEPEILIIDEVLAVGDAEFQRKCLGTMNAAARGGRTVLFVSHHLATVENLCQTGLLLDGGRVKKMGPVREVIAAYANEPNRGTATAILGRADRQGSGAIRFAEVRWLDAEGAAIPSLVAGSPGVMELRMRNASGAPLRSLHVSIGIDNFAGQRVTTWSTSYAGGDLPATPAGDFTLRVQLPRVALIPGGFTYNLFSTVGGDVADWLRPAGSFEVVAGDYYGSGQLPTSRDGTFLADHSFALVP
ncbi:MAG: ABC transporter ATP-binding protein [Vicinamibacterales bacterium]|jgi:lipopolysaccharide transport system ATP-binding protein